MQFTEICYDASCIYFSFYNYVNDAHPLYITPGRLVSEATLPIPFPEILDIIDSPKSSIISFVSSMSVPQVIDFSG